MSQVADLPPDPSPIQLLTEDLQGQEIRSDRRIIYEYEQGGWNEWHIVFSDGVSGWLSDAQLQYAISFVAGRETAPALRCPIKPRFARQEADIQQYRVRGRDDHVAMYKGVEGELPFPYYGSRYAVRRSPHLLARFRHARLQEAPPLLFLASGWSSMSCR